MQIIQSHKVSDAIEDVRIYDYCNGLFDQIPSRKGVKKAIERGEILLNGKPTETGYWLKGGELIELVDLEKKKPKPYRLALQVEYEDEHVAGIVKPPGLLTSGNAFKTVTNAIQFNLKASDQVDALKWPSPVHRLDKQTSGLMLIAKTKTAQIELGKQFELGQIEKTYHAVVLGKVEGSGSIKEKIEGKEAITAYESIQVYKSLRSEFLSLMKLMPQTGRTHQLRIHLSKMENAILGDPIYSPKELYLKQKGLFLCATEIAFLHPSSSESIHLQIPIPQKFKKRLESEERRWLRKI